MSGISRAAPVGDSGFAEKIHPGCASRPNALNKHPMKGSARWAFALVAAISILSLSAYGQQRPQIEIQTPETNGDQKVPIDTLELETGYVFQSDLNHGGSHGAQDEVENSFSYTHRFQITGNWYFRGGLAYQRFDFGNTDAPVPVHLQSGAAILSIDYMHGDDIGAMLEVRPGFYTEEHIGLNSFDCPMTLMRFWVVRPREFYLLTGVNYSFLRGGAGVAPVLGVVWVPTKQIRIMAVPTSPRLIYSVSKQLDLFIGGEFAGGSYRTDHHDGYKGIPHVEKLSGTQLDFSDYRVGGGFEWSPTDHIDIDLSAGCSIQRAFLYHRAGENFRTDPSPYLHLAIKASF